MMKGILTVFICVVSALNVWVVNGGGIPLATDSSGAWGAGNKHDAALRAEPVWSCTLPAEGSSFQQDIAADSFRNADEVVVRIQQVPAGRIQAAVWDDGDNAVTCRFLFPDEPKGQSPGSMSLIVRNNVECHVAEQTLSAEQTGYLVVSSNAKLAIKQPVHVIIGMISQSQPESEPAILSGISIDLPSSVSEVEPVLSFGSVPVWAWIAMGAAFIGACVLLVLILVRRKKRCYSILTPYAQIELPLSGFRNGRELSVGRSSSCDVLLPVEDVSGSHGVFLILDGQLAFRDGYSTNGTCLNEQPIKPGTAVILTSGDVLRLGKEATISIL